ncbi:hypothetical protein [Bacillus toyonensis]|uniref:hypothetical protein n=1 Tax=Bacillus toyonensis TaxID=155322 RepID=UPI002E1FEEFA|nr:hypothetical protein [Bacillus toyonensis]
MQGKVVGRMTVNGKQLLLVEGDQQANRAFGAGAAIGAGVGSFIPGIGTGGGAVIGAGVEAILDLF